MRGENVVYIHYEEPDATSTVERLRLIGLHPDQIKAQLHFIAPQRALQKLWLEPLIAARPALVIHDGVNQAMLLQSSQINAEATFTFRRTLVVPFTAAGAATLACDHLPMVKDESRVNAYGDVHKGNALDGVRIALENEQPFGRGMRGVSWVYVTKDRPGYLRSHGRATKIAQKTFMGTLVVDDSETAMPRPDIAFYAPKDDANGTDSESLSAVIATGFALADLIWNLIHAQPDHTIGSVRKLQAALRDSGEQHRDAKVAEELDDLVYAGRLVEVAGLRGAKGYRTTAAHAKDEFDDCA
ncbi:hypothetical protein DQP58_00075 [Mycobacterium colombiense]|uniref:Uncharacterized protein n=2 Tax=Mycobacterium colombiense TaxID=339268 RepID=A0A329L3C7_9MYCO|nr:hypothetical protein DQP58_00075 [Mycobacterium colombiense]